jgi:hypothetical protein
MTIYPLFGGRLYDEVKADHGRTAGTYRLRLRSEDLEGFTPIARLLGTDTGGTLYIGASADLPARLGTLLKSISAAYNLDGYRDAAAHGVGRMIRPAFVAAFTPARLCVETHRYFTVASPTHSFNHYTEEWRLLMQYVEQFGEFPPLNGPKPSKVN